MHDAFKVYTVIEKLPHKIESIFALGMCCGIDQTARNVRDHGAMLTRGFLSYIR